MPETRGRPITADTLRIWGQWFIAAAVLLIGAGGAWATMHTEISDLKTRVTEIEARVGHVETSSGASADTVARVKALEESQQANSKILASINQRLTQVVCKIDPPHCIENQGG